MTFWIVTSFMALAVCLLIAMVLLRARKQGAPAAAYDLKVYRQQLRELDKDLARGVINQGDAERTQTEISRRILAADEQLQNHPANLAQPRRVTVGMAVLVAVLVLGGSMGLYYRLGVHGYGDMPLADRIEQAQERATDRPSQAQAEAGAPPQPQQQVEDSYLQLVEQLRQTAGERSNDAQGQALLVQHEANLGNFVAAYQAKQNYIRILSGDGVAKDHAETAELMIMAAGGYVSLEAEDELRRALELDKGNGPARYYWGLMLGQIGRPDRAYQIWSETLQAGPATAAWIPGIQAQIAEMAYRAGVDHSPITPQPEAGGALSGPTAEEMAGAQDMSSEDRQQMIRGMVSNLAERLASEGGSAQEWARLIVALSVLNEGDRARTIHREALQNFAEDAEAVALITGAAQQAGLLQ
ncbi:c-type cytochrome biogenesis protein CcmI [Parasedimentitalea psychrophila]|uniref:C-type cytochrome biogenesis protein CcmI n=1 Tax=Parasedimentitalea psychrophila TaxID=2997337 RepID=A0A9Y2KZL4_9RHOB|nr:c-type cytochrome biogenesis protein CcmI [Parasedimentitalea psychrophila]WIY25240.1 c-type cytochrome biogenesis protein CcmI [Parasedimentitalea psychrophila]